MSTWKQRAGACRSRRQFLRAVGAGATAAIAGCQASGSSGESAAVDILSAGSLQHALVNGLKPAVDVPVQIEPHGSTHVARLVDEGQRDPDIVTVADIALFEAPLSPPWHVVFASNAVVLAYNPETEGGRRLAEAGSGRWYEPLVDGEVSLGRTDPTQDPLGYRTLFTLQLASRYYDDAPNLRERLPHRKQIYPETGLLSQFETGAIDAAFAYRNMAVERGYEYVDLPDQVDLSNPEHVEDWYSTVAYELPSGQVIRGGLVSYGSTILNPSDAARAVFDAHTTGAYLDEAGFLRREQFPSYEGSVPDAVRQTTGEGDGRSASPAGTSALAGGVSDGTVLH